MKFNAYKDIAVVDEATLKAFRENTGCRVALRELVEESVKHWERSAIATNALWEAVQQKYDPEGNLEDYQYNIVKNKLVRRSAMTGNVSKLVREQEERQALLDYYKDLLNKGE